jgi:hypothetical protein
MNIDNILKSFEIAVEETLNPSSKDMRLLKDRLSSLLKETNQSSINVEKCNLTLNTKNKKKPHSIVPDEHRCEALICDLDMNKDNKLVPSRCKRSMLNNSKFCKQHGSVDGTVNAVDSEHFGKEIVHDFKWGHLGTIHSPSYVFEKSYDILLKKYNAKNKLMTNTEIENVKENTYKKTENKKDKLVKCKRTIANAFITYKSDNFGSIKSSILSNNLNISGRDLVVAITKEASERWKSISEEDKAMYKKKALANKTAFSKPVALLIQSDTDEEEIYIPKIEQIEDESTLVYNSTLNIWVDTDNNLCYENKDNTSSPCGQLQRGKMTVFPKK